MVEAYESGDDRSQCLTRSCARHEYSAKRYGNNSKSQNRKKRPV